MERPDYYGNPAELQGDIAVVRRAFAAFAARDVDAALPLLAADCEMHMIGTAERAGRSGPYTGHAGAREYFADVEREWDELVLHGDDVRAIPGAVIVLGHVSGAADGRSIRRAAVWTWKLRDGRVASVRVADMGDLG